MILKLIYRIFFISLFLFVQLVHNIYAETSFPFRGEVNSNNINIRSNSTVNSEVVCNLNKGSPVEVVLELYGWYKIRLPKNAPSYIKKNLVGLINDKTARALKDRVNIRLHPNELSPILGRVNKNEIISILEDKGEWYKIEPVNNSFGWIHKKFVDKVEISKTETLN
jgi:uncharacterized protein YgiM (DUF1202 family)